MLSPLAEVALKATKKIAKDIATTVYQKTIDYGLAATAADLILNNGQTLLTLAHKYPTALGWLEMILTALK